ncbi:MAG: efflux RND transporter periplasmic adaptor subunit, partial [Noviherbaspirillum sp.]
MLKRRSFWIVLAVCLLVVGVATTLKKQGARATPAPSTAVQGPAFLEFLPSDVIQVGTRELRQLLRLSGSLRAVNQASV